MLRYLSSLMAPVRPPRDKPHTLGVLGIMKNEARNIDEWIAHYRWQGAGVIFLIDNGSTDGSLETARAWQDRANVRSISLPIPYQQKRHYWSAFRKFDISGACEWLAVADLDEFWFSRDGRSMAETLRAGYEDVDLIYAYWSSFGSNGFKDHPRSLRRDLTLRQPGLGAEQNSKWICRTDIVRHRRSLGVHKVTGANPDRTITDNETFQLNHYITQSEAFFRDVKMTRGDATARKIQVSRDMDYFRAIDAACTETDTLLADRVRAADGS